MNFFSSEKNADKEILKKEVEKLRESAGKFFKDYNVSVDKRLFSELMKIYLNDVPEQFKLDISREIDNKYKVFAISKSDKVQLTDLTGGYIISKQPDSPAVPPKRFGIGPYIGYGVSAGTNLPARFGWGIGFSLHYDILQFNVPKIGK